MSNINITSKNTGKISVSVKPSTPVTISPKAQTQVSIKGVVGATHDLSGTDFGLLYKSGSNKISTSAVTYDANSQLVTFPGGISPLSIYDQNDSRGTAGQILSSTGTALDWISLTEIAGVNGTGTANYVAKWTDGDSITDSSIYDDGTNVGIGTTSPDSLLELFSNSTADFLKLTSGGSGANPIKIIFEKTAVEQGVIEYNRNGDLELYNTDGDGGVMINGRNSADGDFYVNNSGNVGIGTTNPSWKLHVNSETRAGIFGYSTPWTSDGVLYVGAYHSTHTPLLVEHHSASASSYFFAKFRNTNDEDVIKLRTDGSADFDGKLKVNTTNSIGRITVNPTTDSNDAIGIDERGFIAFADAGTINTRLRGLPGGNFQFQGSAYDTFFNISKGGNSYLNTTGNFGIGITSPSAKLHVDGNIRVGDANDVIFTNKLYGLSTGDLTIYTLGNTLLTQTGNVGIGTTSPSHKLHVANGSNTLLVTRDVGTEMRLGIGAANPSYSIELGSYTSGSIGGVKYLLFQNSNRIDSTNSRLAYKSNIGHYFYPYSHNPSYDAYGVAIRHLRDSATNTNDDVLLIEKNDGTDLFKVKSDGDVIITGTANFESDLTVEGNLTVNGTTTTLNTTELTIEDKNIVLANGAADAAAANGAGITIDGADATLTYNSTNDSFDFNKEVVVDKGVTNQRSKLEDTGLYISRTSNGEYSSYIEGANNNLHIKARSDIRFIGNLTTILTIRESNGSVGIGTTAPQSKLTIGAQAGTIATIADFRGNSDNDFIQVARATTTDRGVKVFASGRINASSTHTSEAAYVFDNTSSNTTTTGDRKFFQINGGWSPSSGTSTWAQTLLTPTINTTGTYAGTVRGIYYNPTVTSATGATHRAIETTSGDVIFNGGKVGIGTTSPSQKLDVSGNVNVTGAIYGGNEIRVGSAQWLRFGTKPTLWADATTVILRGGSGNDAFKYEDSSGNEKLRITSDGKLGIGTTAPSGKLHVSSTTGWGGVFERGIKDGDTSSFSHYYSAGNAHILGRVLILESSLTFSNSTADATTKEYRLRHNSNKLRLESVVAGVTTDNNIIAFDGGKVGIGTDSPVLGGSSGLNIYDTNYPQLKLTSSVTGTGTTSGFLIGLTTNDGGEAQIVNYENAGIKFSTNNSARFIISKEGRVGIGTTSPSGHLHVIDSGNLSSGGIFIENTGTTAATLGLENTEGISKLFTNNGVTTLRNTRTGFSNYSIDVGGLGVKITEGNGGQNADASAILELDSTTQGVLFPRMTEGDRTSIGSPATGLIVYQTDGDEGLYIYKSTGWIQII